MEQRVRIIRAIGRSYGYAIQYVEPIPQWVTGPQNTAGWYRFKRDAIARAVECGYILVK
jgi:hypothetical protein